MNTQFEELENSEEFKQRKQTWEECCKNETTFQSRYNLWTERILNPECNQHCKNLEHYEHSRQTQTE